MYLKPAPMQPDTFSQYGYADAGNLRALRRGYGHDIYPQFPTTYNMPRVVQYGHYVSSTGGLGAYKSKGLTLEYYADPRSLKFDDQNLKRLYETLRKADVDFQKMMRDAARAISPALDMLQGATGIKKQDIQKALRVTFPTAGVALLLEVSAGKRPLDQGFAAAAQMIASDLRAAGSLFTALSAIGGAAIAGTATGVGAVVAGPVAAVLGPAMPFLIPAAGVCAVVSLALAPFGKGKLPSKEEFKKSVRDAAALTGKPAPSDSELDRMYAGMSTAKQMADASASASATTATASKSGVTKKQRRQTEPRAPSSLPPETSAKPSAKGTAAVVVGIAALAAVVVATR